MLAAIVITKVTMCSDHTALKISDELDDVFQKLGETELQLAANHELIFACSLPLIDYERDLNSEMLGSHKYYLGIKETNFKNK